MRPEDERAIDAMMQRMDAVFEARWPRQIAEGLLNVGRPNLEALLRANATGYSESLTASESESVGRLVDRVVALEDADFTHIFCQYHSDKKEFARHFWLATQDLQRAMSGTEVYRPLTTVGFADLSPQGALLLRRLSVAVGSWKISMLGQFFERNWGEPVARYKHLASDASATGCTSFLAIAAAVTTLVLITS